MNIRRVFLYILVLTLSVGAMAAPPFVPNVVLVKFQPGAEVAALQVVASPLDLVQSTRIGKTNIYRLQSRSQDAPVMVAALKARSDVLIAEPDYIGYLTSTNPNDPYWSDPGMWNLRQIGAPSAWDVTTGAASVVVAVLDSGARYTHQDLAANMWNNPGTVYGCLAGTHGYDFVANTCDPFDIDNVYFGHGTAMSGIIGARGNNALGLVGINWTTSIMALKVVNKYGEQVLNSKVIAAMDFAVQAKQAGVNVRILNCSFTTEGYSHSVQDEINIAGDNNILTVASAGNSSSNIDLNPVYPASYTWYPSYLGTIITVAATGPTTPGDSNDNLASYSNYGPNTVQLGAPGGDAGSRLDVLRDDSDSSYNIGRASGTSEAAALTSGAAALVLSACPSLSVYQLKYVLLNTGDIDTFLSGYTGTGRRLNVSSAIASCH